MPEDAKDAQAGLEALGFERKGSRWVAHLEDAAAALALEMRVVDLAVDNPAFAHLRMWQVDAVSRFGTVVETSS